MALDGDAWQEAITHYRAWNRAKFRARVKGAGRKSLAEKWDEYLALIEFGLRLRPQPTRRERRQKMECWAQYYRLVQEFEERRQCEQSTG